MTRVEYLTAVNRTGFLGYTIVRCARARQLFADNIVPSRMRSLPEEGYLDNSSMPIMLRRACRVFATARGAPQFCCLYPCVYPVTFFVLYFSMATFRSSYSSHFPKKGHAFFSAWSCFSALAG